MRETSERDPQIRVNVREEEAFLNSVFEGAQTDPYRNLLLFSGAVWAACRMNAWCFDASSGKVLNSFSAHEKDLASFFVIGKCLDYVTEHREHRYPFLLSDALGMVWIAEYSPINKEKTTLLFVYGPVFTSVTSPMVISENLERMNFSLSVRRQLEKVLAEIPVLMNSVIEQYARMLHFSLTGEFCDSKQFMLQKARVEIDLFPEQHEARYEDLTSHHLPLERTLAQEEQLLALVREGRLDERLLSSVRAQADYTDYREGNPLRSVKDELIILATKYMLTTEQAGLPLRISRTLQLRYIRIIENARSTTELTDVERSMTEDFITRVQEMNTTPEKSREILIAEDYIRSNLTRPLSIEEVARHVGYTDYYLSRKFARETGLKFADYVNRERVRYAQALLRSGTMQIQAISDLLQFSSLSYFGRVFRKFTGLTPKEYREGKETEGKEN